MRVFLAGASGVIGRRLCILLRDAKFDVVGTTRSATKAEALRTLGVTPAIVDVFDAQALLRAVASARPDVVVHQLTDLPQSPVGSDLAAAFAHNARIRIEATPNLMLAAKVAGAKRAVVQSVCFAYADGPKPQDETTPLDPAPERKVTVDGVSALEEAALGTPEVDGLVLRYGRLYGPGTWADVPKAPALHVDAAAHAAFLAISRGAPGLYNVAENDGAVTSEKAKRELGFDASFRIAS